MIVELSLQPTYALSLELVGQEGTLSIGFDDPITVSLNEVLRGEKGDTGVGLLGYEVVPDGVPIQVDLSKNTGLYLLTLVGNRTLTFVNGSLGIDRKRFMLEVTQGGAGSWLLSPGASVALGVDLPEILLSAPAGAVDILGFIYYHSTGKCRYIAINHGS